ncbi:MAG: four helix bundle protein [Patescibacteria group bacterium]
MSYEKIKDFTDLRVWQESHKLVLLTYLLTKKFPAEEKFSLTSQLRRAVVSITSNVAEGFGRQSYKERIQFYYMAQGSLIEVKNQLLVARDIGYLDKINFEKVMEQSNVAHQLLQGLIRSSKEYLTRNS